MIESLLVNVYVLLRDMMRCWASAIGVVVYGS
jgi:hypothetical protein